MLWFRWYMIQIEPVTSRNTTITPKAKARTLLVLSGPVVMCRKNTRCTPIWAMAKTTMATGTAGAQGVCGGAARGGRGGGAAAGGGPGGGGRARGPARAGGAAPGAGAA